MDEPTMRKRLVSRGFLPLLPRPGRGHAGAPAPATILGAPVRATILGTPVRATILGASRAATMIEVSSERAE